MSVNQWTIKSYTGILIPWLTEHIYRKKLTISGRPFSGTGYQILIRAGENYESSDYDFHLEGHSLDFPAEENAGGDLRFTAADGTTLLDFWVERIAGTGPNRTAYVWVKVSEDLNSDRDIYCYYGSEEGINLSNGETTFLAFEDCKLDPGIVNEGNFKFSFGFDFDFTNQYALDMDYLLDDYVAHEYSVATEHMNKFSENPNAFSVTADTDHTANVPAVNVYDGDYYQISVDTPYRLSFRRDTTALKLYLDDTLVSSSNKGDNSIDTAYLINLYSGGGANGTVTYDSVNKRLKIFNYRDDAKPYKNITSYISKIRLRKFVTNEPFFYDSSDEQVQVIIPSAPSELKTIDSNTTVLEVTALIPSNYEQQSRKLKNIYEQVQENEAKLSDKSKIKTSPFVINYFDGIGRYETDWNFMNDASELGLFDVSGA